MNYQDLTVSEADFFIKENAIITILPQYSDKQYNFISGDYGPFKPNTLVNVPLWLAIYLKERNKCRILPPPWLNDLQLSEILNQEMTNKDDLYQLPFNFYELAHILLKYCQDDLQNPIQIQELIESIEDRREAKIADNISKISINTNVIQLNNITSYEINKRRNSISTLLTNLSELKSFAQIENNNLDGNSSIQTHNSMQ